MSAAADMNIKKRFPVYLCLRLVLVCCLVFPAVSAQSQDSPVTAVIFYSPDCLHCHQVIEEILIPLSFQFQNALQIFAIDTTTAAGNLAFQNYIETFQIPAYRQGVPAFVVGDAVLAGDEIVQKAEGVIENALSAGEASFPAVPGLFEEELDLKTMEEVRNEFLHSPAPPPPPPDELEAVDEALGLSVFFLLVLSAGYFFIRLFKYGLQSFPGVSKPKLPFFMFILVLAGLAISIYLSYVEIRQVEALCGPVGDCNAVHDSAFSNILGVPVAVLGAVYYAVFALLLMIYNTKSGIPARVTAAVLILLGLVAVLYSLFLTCMEIWVIQAVCAWCSGSALISAALLVMLSKKLIHNPVIT